LNNKNLISEVRKIYQKALIIRRSTTGEIYPVEMVDKQSGLNNQTMMITTFCDE